MKKYIKPSIETIEANLSADCLDDGVSQVHNAVGNGQLAPGKKGSSDDDWAEEDDFGW